MNPGELSRELFKQVKGILAKTLEIEYCSYIKQMNKLQYSKPAPKARYGEGFGIIE